jgi:very-short-patch-repair endonuclease/transposase-like protein
MAKLTEQEKQQIVDLYLSGKSYRDIEKITGYSTGTIWKNVKGLRSKGEANTLARKQGKCKLTKEGREKLSNSAKKRIKSSNKVWTKPEQEFKTILNDLGIGVQFPDDVKELLDIEDDINPEICFQYPLQRYICDFVDVENKIVYQVNGDFWHANPILYAEEDFTKIQRHNVHHDKNRKKYLENKGFTVCDFWESEIFWNQDLVKDRIRATRKKANPPVLHTGNTGSVTQVAYSDWSEKLRDLWFKKPKGRPKKKVIEKICISCGKKFTVENGRKKDARYCTRKCTDLGNRKVSRPSKDQLEEDIKNMSYCAIGRKYNVSDNAVRKWARKYEIL